MGNTLQSSQSPRKSVQRKPASDAASQVEMLRAAFAQFRATHSPGTKIPDSLRQAVVAAIQAGLDRAQVRSACRITNEQVAYWVKAQRRAMARPSQLAPLAPPQVFPVVGAAEQAATSDPIGTEPTGPCLQLRLAGFAISIRSVPDTSARPTPQRSAPAQALP